MLHAVTFDLWGTLYQRSYARDERLRLLQQALARHAQPRSWKALLEAYGHALSVWDRVWRNEHRSITTECWLRQALTFLKADLPRQAVAALCPSIEEIYLHDAAPPIPVPGVADILPRLSRRYRLGLISDVGLTPGRVLRELLRRDGLLPHFSMLTFSDEVGQTKPMPEPFLRTLHGLEAHPEEAAHVGDLPETDLVGARAVGMKTVLFLGVSHREDGLPLADAAFEQYGELERLLATLVRCAGPEAAGATATFRAAP